MNLTRLYKKKSRGVTPVIATVMLIALVIVAGIGVALVLFSTISTPAPLKVEVIDIFDFETTDNDIFIDQFEATIENTERTNVRIGNDAFELLWYENDTSIQGWKMDLDVDELILTANNIMNIPLKCSVDQGELIPENDTIYIKITVTPQGNDNPRAAVTFGSKETSWFHVGDTIGPVYLDTPIEDLAFDSPGAILNFTATNDGSTNLDLSLEFSTDNSNSFYFTINGINKTSLLFSMSKYSFVDFNTETITINATSRATASDTGVIFIFLRNRANFDLLAMNILILTFTG